MNIRGTARLLALMTAVLISATACGGGDDKTEPAGAATSAASADQAAETEAATEPEVVEATPEQLASVIAGYEKDWREVIDGAEDCRWDWTITQDDPMVEMRSMTCYMRESTIGMTTKTAADELGELTAPASMTSLVDETNTALAGVYDVDLEAACGAVHKGPVDSKKCTSTIGDRYWAYSQLEGALDQWSPYL